MHSYCKRKVKGKVRALKKKEKKKESFSLDSLTSVSLSFPQCHFLVHSCDNKGQRMRGFSRSMWNLAFCVAAAQAAATEARGEIEFSWNSPVSLALGWTVRLDWTGLSALCLACSWCLRDCWLGRPEAELGPKGDYASHHQLVMKICLARIAEQFSSNSCFTRDFLFRHGFSETRPRPK